MSFFESVNRQEHYHRADGAAGQDRMDVDRCDEWMNRQERQKSFPAWTELKDDHDRQMKRNKLHQQPEKDETLFRAR